MFIHFLTGCFIFIFPLLPAEDRAPLPYRRLQRFVFAPVFAIWFCCSRSAPFGKPSVSLIRGLRPIKTGIAKPVCQQPVCLCLFLHCSLHTRTLYHDAAVISLFFSYGGNNDVFGGYSGLSFYDVFYLGNLGLGQFVHADTYIHTVSVNAHNCLGKSLRL